MLPLLSALVAGEEGAGGLVSLPLPMSRAPADAAKGERCALLWRRTRQIKSGALVGLLHGRYHSQVRRLIYIHSTVSVIYHRRYDEEYVDSYLRIIHVVEAAPRPTREEAKRPAQDHDFVKA